MQKKLGIKNGKKTNNEKATIDCIPPAISRGFFRWGNKKDPINYYLHI
ncbi:hypothetical protein [Sporosarcina koreensis]|nr:hypothetical protein [Sporosarcina koreensis]